MILKPIFSIFLLFTCLMHGVAQTVIPSPQPKPDDADVLMNDFVNIEFYRYYLDQDINFSKIQFLGIPGLGGGVGRCMTFDFSIYGIDGNRLYSEENGTLVSVNVQTITGEGKIVKLTFPLQSNVTLKKGFYYFGFTTKRKYAAACPYQGPEGGSIRLQCFSIKDLSNTQVSDDVSYLVYTKKDIDEGFPQKLSFTFCDNERPPSGAPYKLGCWQTYVQYKIPFIKLRH